MAKRGAGQCSFFNITAIKSQWSHTAFTCFQQKIVTFKATATLLSCEFIRDIASQWKMSEGILSYDLNWFDLSTELPIVMTTKFYFSSTHSTKQMPSLWMIQPITWTYFKSWKHLCRKCQWQTVSVTDNTHCVTVAPFRSVWTWLLLTYW